MREKDAEDLRRRTVLARTPTPSASTPKPNRVAWPVFLFLISLIIPFIFSIGPLRLSAYRLVLIIMVIPLVWMWISGRAGRVRPSDIALFIFWFWCSLSFAILHSPSISIQAIGILFVETTGAYLMGRVYIRTAEDFYAMVSLLFKIILFLLPFSIFESLTSNNISLGLANKVLPSFTDVAKDPRWGLDRVQGPFEHPILYGVFSGTMLSLTFFVLGYGRSWLRRFSQTAIAAFTAALALSSGPLSALTAQAALILWDGIFDRLKSRWVVLAVGTTLIVIALEMVANRHTPELFISYFAFSTETAYNRLAIWNYGSISVVNHPLIGIGFNSWERPWYMSDSMDMFWLVPAVRHGLPAALLMQFAVFWIFITVVFKGDLSDRDTWYRTGFLICIVGYYITGWTVHYLNASYVQFLFILGSGLWFLDVLPETDSVSLSARNGSDLTLALNKEKITRAAPSTRFKSDNQSNGMRKRVEGKRP